MRADLEKVIAMPKARTKTWLTTCYPQGTEEIDASLCGAAYHVRALHRHQYSGISSVTSLSESQHSA